MIRLPIVEVGARPAPREVAFDPRCVMCGRPRSTHGDPVDVGGERIVPACHLIHRGTGLFPEGPAAPPVRELVTRLRAARTMPVRRARAIAGSLGSPSKMPGPSYGLDAFACKTGSILARTPGSSCEHCYARRNFYRYYYPALKARHHRQRAIHHPEWTEAMIALLEDYERRHRGAERVFRWHDSGDLDSADHLERIAAVAEATPLWRHWLPTREYGYVQEFLARGGRIPDNLTVRLSSYMVGAPAFVPPVLRHLPTSTVHRRDGYPVGVSARRGDSIACRAWSRGNHCGPCRACWDARVRNVSYPEH